MLRTVQFNVTIIKGPPQGRSIYAMPLPDNFDLNYKEEYFLKADRMLRFRTKESNIIIQKMNWVYKFSELEKLDGSHNIGFFQSYYYQRLVQQSNAILPNGQRKSMEGVVKILQKSRIHYQIQLIDNEDGSKQCLSQKILKI